MAAKPAFVVDCDSHVFEPSIIWDEFLEPAYRVPARSAFWHHVHNSGLISVIVNGKPARPMNQGKLIRQAIWEPGMTPEKIGGLDPSKPRPITPGGQDPKARLRDMDTMGIQASLVFPTLFAEYFPVVENPDVAYALARAYNDWVLTYASAAPQRLFPVAVLPLQDIAFAIEELRRAAGLGFKAAFLRPSFFDSRFLVHRSLEPIWAAFEKLGVVAFVHPSPGSTNPQWTSTGAFVERVAANLQVGHNVAEAAAPRMDSMLTLAAFAFCGHMENYPKLKLAFAHAGASWVPLVLEKAETYLTLTSGIRDVSLEPRHVFEQHPALVTFDAWEATVARLPDLFRDKVAWGSRYPHHDASTPEEAVAMLQKHGALAEDVRKVMGENAARFLGISATRPAKAQ